MKIVELILDEDETYNGIDAISIVENPAIEEDFVALKNQKKIFFAEVNKDKKLLMGALLTPNRPIYRRQEDEEYYIYFSRHTVRKASQMFLKGGNQYNTTLEHKIPLKGLTLVESWIVEDKEKDKSSLYNMDVPVGTWMGTIKVENDQIWNEYVKTGKVKGFSIEGYFADKADVKKENMSMNNKQQMLSIEEEEARELLSTIKGFIKEGHEKGKTKMVETFTDYPTSVKNNAKRGLALNKKNGNKCATQVGKVRAQQLAQGKPVSETTIKRMYSYLSRAETYYDNGTPEDCGYISYLLWGGKSAKSWAERKIKKFEGTSDKTKLATMRVTDDYAIIDDRLAFPTEEKATSMADDLGCKGFHEHEIDGEKWYMPCEEHSVSTDLKKPCWDGYEMVGFKMKNGKKVPNCVPQS